MFVRITFSFLSKVITTLYKEEEMLILKKEEMDRIILKKVFIISLLCIFIVIFCICYKNTRNGIASLIKDIAAYTAGGSELTGVFDKLSMTSQSVFVQFPIRFINEMLSLYISSGLLLGLFKIWNLFVKNKLIINFKNIVDVYYLGLYVVIFGYFVQIIFMVLTGTSFDIQSFTFSIMFQLAMLILHSSVIISIIKKKHNILWSSISFFLIVIIMQLLVRVGSLYV